MLLMVCSALMDHGVLEVVYRNAPLSMQEVYEIAMNMKEPLVMERIAIYLDLFRLGYILMRASIYCNLRNQSLEKYPSPCSRVMYFVWLPNHKETFKKSDPEAPVHCLIGASTDCQPFSALDFEMCSKALTELNPVNPPKILLAIVDTGNTISWIQCSVSDKVPDIRGLD